MEDFEIFDLKDVSVSELVEILSNIDVKLLPAERDEQKKSTQAAMLKMWDVIPTLIRKSPRNLWKPFEFAECFITMIREETRFKEVFNGQQQNHEIRFKAVIQQFLDHIWTKRSRDPLSPNDIEDIGLDVDHVSELVAFLKADEPLVKTTLETAKQALETIGKIDESSSHSLIVYWKKKVIPQLNDAITTVQGKISDNDNTTTILAPFAEIIYIK